MPGDAGTAAEPDSGVPSRLPWSGPALPFSRASRISVRGGRPARETEEPGCRERPAGGRGRFQMTEAFQLLEPQDCSLQSCE